MTAEIEIITEDWLKTVGFKWHQLNRQPTKQWLLWCGIPNQPDNWGVDSQDIGVEVSEGRDGSWFVWLRSDTAHRYSLHIRHMRRQEEIVRLVEAVTGLPWKPANHIYGAVCTQTFADRHRAESDRLDRKRVSNDRRRTART